MTSTLRQQAEQLVYALGIAVYIRDDGTIHQHPPENVSTLHLTPNRTF